MLEQEKLILVAICCGENAKSLREIAEIATQLTFAEVVDVVDSLVAQHILQSDNSFAHSEIGEMNYSFASNDTAQAAYTELQKMCEWQPVCDNDAEYMFFPEEKEVYHARFCREHRKSMLFL
jgi:hypothetical protein